MLVVVATPEGSEILSPPLCAWSAARLIGPTILMTAGEAGKPRARVINAGQASDRELTIALAGHDVGSLTIVVAAIGEETERPAGILAAQLAAVPLLKAAVGDDAWTTPALVAIPGAGGSCGADLFLPSLDPWIVAAAEDRAHPRDVNTLLDHDLPHLGRHAAHAIVSIANAWTFTPDEPGFIVSARKAGNATAGRFEMVRCYTGLIDGGYLVDHVAVRVLRPGARWPNPDPDAFDDVDLEDEQIQAIADEFLRVHAATLGLTPATPVVLEPTKLGLWEAIKAVFRFFIDMVRRLPERWLDDRIGRLHDAVADRVEAMGTGVKVRRWGEREPGEAPPKLLDGLMGQRLTFEPGAVGPTWRDMWQLSIGLTDGTELPAELDVRFLMAGQRRLLQSDPRLIVPDPEDRPPGLEDRAEARACDPMRFDALVTSTTPADGEDPDSTGAENPAVHALGAWHSRRARSLLWRVGAGIAQGLQQAEHEEEDQRPTTEEWDDLEKLTTEAAAATKMVRRRYLTGILLRTVLAVAVSFGLVFSDIPWWVKLGGPPLIWLLWLFFLGRGWQRASRRSRFLEDEAVERSEQLAHRQFVSVVRGADVERLRSRYAEYLDWAEIIGWYLHRPFVGRERRGAEAAARLDPESMPAAFRAGIAEVGPSTLDTLCAAVRSRLFRSSWLKSYYEGVRDGLVGDWEARRGRDAQQSRPEGFADNSRGASSLRRHLVAEARRGTGRGFPADTLSSELIDVLSERTLGELVDGVVPVGGGEETALPPIGAWPVGPDDLAVVAEPLQLTVVRLRIVDGDSRVGGTGFVVHSSGVIVTNAHVVGSSTQVEVDVPGVGWVTGKVGPVAADTDLAVIVLDGSFDLTAVRLGVSSDLSIGTKVFTLGFPRLLDGTPTFSYGEITATRRFADHDAGWMEVIQSSYAATGGASGSPVFDASGVVVGVHQGGATSKDGDRAADYMSFAIPVDVLRRWLEEVGQSVDDGLSSTLSDASSRSHPHLISPQAFFGLTTKPSSGSLSDTNRGDGAFAAKEIVERSLWGWGDRALMGFSMPLRVGGVAVESTDALKAPTEEFSDRDDEVGADADERLV